MGRSLIKPGDTPRVSPHGVDGVWACIKQSRGRYFVLFPLRIRLHGKCTMRLYNPHSSNPLATSRCTKQASLATKSFVPITLSSPLAPNRAILNGTRSLAPKGTPGSSKRNEETNTSGYASDGRIEQSSTDSSLSNIIIAATKGSLQGTHVSKPLFRKVINRGSRAKFIKGPETPSKSSTATTKQSSTSIEQVSTDSFPSDNDPAKNTRYVATEVLLQDTFVKREQVGPHQATASVTSTIENTLERSNNCTNTTASSETPGYLISKVSSDSFLFDIDLVKNGNYERSPQSDQSSASRESSSTLTSQSFPCVPVTFITPDNLLKNKSWSFPARENKLQDERQKICDSDEPFWAVEPASKVATSTKRASGDLKRGGNTFPIRQHLTSACDNGRGKVKLVPVHDRPSSASLVADSNSWAAFSAESYGCTVPEKSQDQSYVSFTPIQRPRTPPKKPSVLATPEPQGFSFFKTPYQRDPTKENNNQIPGAIVCEKDSARDRGPIFLGPLLSKRYQEADRNGACMSGRIGIDTAKLPVWPTKDSSAAEKTKPTKANSIEQNIVETHMRNSKTKWKLASYGGQNESLKLLDWETPSKICSNNAWTAIRRDKILTNTMVVDQVELEGFSPSFIRSTTDTSTLHNYAVRLETESVRVINKSRAEDVHRFLSKFKGLTHQYIASAIDSVCEDSLTLDQLRDLALLLPTVQEQRDLKAYIISEESQRWPIEQSCEQFMVKMISVDKAKWKVSTMVFMKLFPEFIKELQNDLALLQKACERTMASSTFRRILGSIIQLKSEIQLSPIQTAIDNHSMTILVSVARTIHQNDPHILSSFEFDLSSLDRVEKVDFKQCMQDMEFINVRLLDIRQQMRDEPSGGCTCLDRLKPTPVDRFLFCASQQINTVSSEVEATKRALQALFHYFGGKEDKWKDEDGALEVFSAVKQFYCGFNTAAKIAMAVEKSKWRADMGLPATTSEI